MNFTEVVSTVLDIVKRPDRLTQIRAEVNAALSFCCLANDFARDLEEDDYAIDSTLYAQSLALATFTRFRKFAYIKPSDVKYYINPISGDKIFTSSRVSGCKEEVDRYYIAGDNVLFKTSALHSTLLIGHFKYPPTLTDASPSFWLLDAAPYAIIERASSQMFKKIGDDASAKTHAASFSEMYMPMCRDLSLGSSA